ncbi:hypothetical protein QA596_02110 [Balneolales bacterium ANBcel1]|nr:hypothetical protein [Balneolales bacterium ANBcel1]
MSSSTFYRTIVSGFIATFVMSMTAFLLGGLGLPVLDIGYIIEGSFNHVHLNQPYNIVWGNAAYFMGGILMALVWVVYLHQRIPLHWFFQGVIYGVIISVVAGLILSPLVALAAGDTVGLFYTDTWVPGRILLAGFIMHLVYGLVLMLCLKHAGVSSPSS